MATTLSDILREYWTPSKNKSAHEMRSTQVVTELLTNIQEHLTEAGQEYRFEWVDKQTLPDVLDAMSDPSLTDIYTLDQESETVFVARMREAF